MHQRLKSIKSIAKALKLRLPFEPSNDNMHDLIDAIVLLCDEPECSVETVTISPDTRTEVKMSGGVKWGVEAHVFALQGSMVTAYLLNGNWYTAGIPKRQPFHEQIEWAANKGATQVKVMADGQETKVSITQYQQ